MISMITYHSLFSTQPAGYLVLHTNQGILHVAKSKIFLFFSFNFLHCCIIECNFILLYFSDTIIVSDIG